MSGPFDDGFTVIQTRYREASDGLWIDFYADGSLLNQHGPFDTQDEIERYLAGLLDEMRELKMNFAMLGSTQ